MSQQTISTKELTNKLRKLYWKISLDHQHFISELHNSIDTSMEQQRFQQYKIAIQEAADVFPEIFIDLYYLDSLIKSGLTELPKQDPEFASKEQQLDLDDVVNRIRIKYWEALVARKEWEDEPGGKEFLSLNHNYDSRIDGFRQVFATLFDFSFNCYHDLDELIKNLHYRFELDSHGSSRYIQFDPETGQDIADPITPQKLHLNS